MRTTGEAVEASVIALIALVGSGTHAAGPLPLLERLAAPSPGQAMSVSGSQRGSEQPA